MSLCAEGPGPLRNTYLKLSQAPKKLTSAKKAAASKCSAVDSSKFFRPGK